jgi:hypothetical protein
VNWLKDFCRSKGLRRFEIRAGAGRPQTPEFSAPLGFDDYSSDAHALHMFEVRKTAPLKPQSRLR